MTLANIHTLVHTHTAYNNHGGKQQCKQSCSIWMGNAASLITFSVLLPLFSCSPFIIPPSIPAAPVETQRNAELRDFFLILPLPFFFKIPCLTISSFSSSSSSLLLQSYLCFFSVPPSSGCSALSSTPSTHTSSLTFEGEKRRKGMDQGGRERRFVDLWGVRRFGFRDEYSRLCDGWSNGAIIRWMKDRVRTFQHS